MSGFEEFVQLLTLVLRGILLWIVVPIAVTSWVFVAWWTKASLGACIGWFSLNLMAFLQHILLRPITRGPRAPWVGLRGMQSTEQRISFLGLW